MRALWRGLALALLAACESRPSPDPCALGSPGPPWLTFVSLRTGSYDLYVARADGSCERSLGAEPSTDLSPAWGPAGRIAFASDRGGVRRIWIHDLATGAEGVLDSGGLAAASPAFSPRGAFVAFEGRQGSGAADVYVVPVAGGAPVNLTLDASEDAGPAWSPDGGTIYFVSSRLGVFEVFSVPASGGPASQVTSGSRIVGRPVPSPDGASLYFARTVAGGSASEVVRLELSTRATTVVSAEGESEPALSSDGTLLATRSFRYDALNAEVVVTPLDGGAPVRVTTDPASDGSPAFSR
jgi:TolB protein